MRVLVSIRKSKITKFVAAFLAINLCTQFLMPLEGLSLTSGPSTPESSSFQQVSASNLVDPFSGDFSYNIPLLEVDGYPINLSYNSNITMDQEASWAGLGWNVNIGSISRSVRGLPDDYWGDKVVHKFNMKPNETIGVETAFDGEFTGLEYFKPSLGLGLTISHNNYDGFDIGSSVQLGAQIKMGKKGSSPTANIGLGLSSDKNGLNINPSLSFSVKNKNRTGYSGMKLGIGLNFNSRAGLGAMHLGASIYGGGVAGGFALGAGVKLSSKIHFATPAYTPQIIFPYRNLSLSFQTKAGGTLTYVDLDGSIRGFGSRQELMRNMDISEGFGYCYSQEAKSNQHALHDFIREKDGPYTPNIQYLPVTNYSYDAFQINAQGLGGDFRAFRNDVGNIYDKEAINPSTSISLGLEANFGNLFSAGLDITGVGDDSKTGKWDNQNGAKQASQFSEKELNKITEPFHFRVIGDRANNESDQLMNQLGGADPVCFQIGQGTAFSVLKKDDGSTIPLSGSVKKNTRGARTTSIEYLTVGEVKGMYPYLAKNIPYFAEDHHIGAIIVVAPNGTRYVFGLPAYNRTQREITFATGNLSSFPSVNADNLVAYTPSDNSVQNGKGIDNFYEETELPPYVYTWHLTAVLSADYVDITGDGPTTDDFGNYTKFNYGIYDEAMDRSYPNLVYKWRAPIADQSFRALNAEGFKTVPYDDSGFITYGEKDIWYIRTIEGKNHVAVFSLSDRDDALGVSTVNSGADPASPKLKKLDKITLYTKDTYFFNPTGKIPIKTVQLNYDYSLCKGVPNQIDQDFGKLTLKEVTTIYEKSGRSKFSPYKFEYELNGGQAIDNPNYDPRANDRWGNYMPSGAPGFPNEDNPYTDKNKTTADTYAQAWKLKQVTVPSGGKITVDYEADDYTYVQNKEAASNFTLVGFSDSPNDPAIESSSKWDLFKANDKTNPYLYVYFTMIPDADGNWPNSSDIPDIKEYVSKHYITGLENNPNGPGKFLYFRTLINVNEANVPKYEYVSGYAEIDLADADYCGALENTSDGNYYTGWIKVKAVDLDNNDNNPTNNEVHPFSKAAWQFSRIHLPRYAYNQSEPNASFGEAMVTFLTNSNVFSQVFQMFQGVNGRMRTDGYANRCEANKSFIRLLSPYGHKMGGGSRVKSISVSDEWAAMTSTETTSTYTQDFTYELEDGRSSGVASWEPSIGADENIFRIPSFYDFDKVLVPDDRFYQEYPVGECYYPGAYVGYSRILITNANDDFHSGSDGIDVNKSGYTVHEFYTARDFPTISNSTLTIPPLRQTSNLLESLFTLSYFDYMTVSQGHAIETNDMHGKTKSTSVYQYGQAIPISQKIYHYKTDANGKLDNQVLLIRPDGSTYTGLLGVDFDMITDFRESTTNTVSGGASLNYAMTYFPPAAVIPAITIFPKYGTEETRFRSAVVTKVIRRSGILDSIESYTLGNKSTAINAAYDDITGEVLLTRVDNEYEDERYSLKIPTHWVYDGMKLSSTNWGYEFEADYNGGSDINWDRTTGAIVSGSDAEDHLKPGDELINMYTVPGKSYTKNLDQVSANQNRAWVIYSPDQDTLFLIDYLGNIITNPGDMTTKFRFKVIRSGMRNQPEYPVQTIDMLDSPIIGNSLVINASTKVLSTSVSEYNEIWRSTRYPVYRYHNQDYTTFDYTGQTYSLITLLNKILQNNHILSAAFLGDPLTEDAGYFPSLQHVFGNTDVCYASSFNWTPSLSGLPPYNGLGTAFEDHSTVNMFFDIGCDDNDRLNMDCRMNLVAVEGTTDFPESSLNNLVALQLVGSFTNLNHPAAADINTAISSNPGSILLQGVLADGTIHYFILENVNDCITFGATVSSPTYVANGECDFDNEEILNPYLWGILGNWGALKSHLFMSDRENQLEGSSENINLREDGIYSNFFSMLFKPNSTENATDKWVFDPGFYFNSGINARWKETGNITKSSPFGMAVESIDPSGIFSSSIYGYRMRLPIASANNCRYAELAFDGFEDYYPQEHMDLSGDIDYFDVYNECNPDHFKFNDYRGASLEQAHTGKYAMKIDAGNDLSALRKINGTTSIRSSWDVPFTFLTNDDLELFGPYAIIASKKFILSYWVRRSDFGPTASYVHDYAGSLVPDIAVDGSPLTLTLLRKTSIIEGWQMFEYEFEVPVSTAGDDFELELSNTENEADVYLDDLRIYPKDAIMQSFVYDAVTGKLMAELDADNFATFYEYDEEGTIIRVKAETERGIMTVQEGRYNVVKRNTQQ